MINLLLVSIIITLASATPPMLNQGFFLETYKPLKGVNINQFENKIRRNEITPSSTKDMKSGFYSTEDDQFFGQRLRAWYIAPETGNYKFFISGNNFAKLFLSTDIEAENKIEIAKVESWTKPMDFNKNPTQKSTNIKLDAGDIYYIEALHIQRKGKTGSVRVKVRTPSKVNYNPIPLKALIYFPDALSDTYASKETNLILSVDAGDVGDFEPSSDELADLLTEDANELAGVSPDFTTTPEADDDSSDPLVPATTMMIVIAAACVAGLIAIIAVVMAVTKKKRHTGSAAEAPSTNYL